MKLNNAPIPRDAGFTGGWVDLDEKLSSEKHIEKTCSKASAETRAMRSIKPLAPLATPHYKLFTKHYWCSLVFILHPFWAITALYS